MEIYLNVRVWKENCVYFSLCDTFKRDMRKNVHTHNALFEMMYANIFEIMIIWWTKYVSDKNWTISKRAYLIRYFFFCRRRYRKKYACQNFVFLIYTLYAYTFANFFKMQLFALTNYTSLYFTNLYLQKKSYQIFNYSVFVWNIFRHH